MEGKAKLSGPDLTQGVELSMVPDGTMLLGHALGEPVLLVRRGDELFAIGAICTHYGAPLDQGLLVGDTVRCPWHHACFSLGTNAADAAALVTKAVDTYGRLDCACNNAGIEGNVVPIAEQSEDNFNRVMTVDAKGTFLCLKYELVHMLKNGGGAIVNLASVAVLVGFPGLGPYVASKHAINGLTKNAALEYSKQGVRVNSICPGGIETRTLDSLVTQASAGRVSTHEMMDPLHPIGRIGMPNEVAELIVWLCSPRASFVTGANIPVDGGYLAQ